MTGFGPMLHKELLEQWRTKRLLVVTIVFLLFGIGSPLLAKYTPELVKALAGESVGIAIPPPRTEDAVVQFLKNLGQTGILAAILLAMGSVANEKERGITALLLTKPLSRGAYLLAKLVAIGLTLLVACVVAAIGGWAYTTFLFEPLPLGGYAAMTALLALQLLAYAALTFLGSALSRSALVAAAIGIGAMILIAVVGALPTIGAWTPGGLAAPAQALAMGGGAGDALRPVAATIGLIAVLFAVAWGAFRSQEL
jgi:ABC-2 type transport system permease protein